MSSQPNLNEMFQEWNDLNIKTQESMGQFDFSTIKKIRKIQKKIEDAIYEILKENAPENIKKIIPEDCGEMEVGFGDKKFYFVMIDPETEEEEEIKLIAITINVEKAISMIKDFNIEE